MSKHVIPCGLLDIYRGAEDIVEVETTVRLNLGRLSKNMVSKVKKALYNGVAPVEDRYESKQAFVYRALSKQVGLPYAFLSTKSGRLNMYDVHSDELYETILAMHKIANASPYSTSLFKLGDGRLTAWSTEIKYTALSNLLAKHRAQDPDKVAEAISILDKGGVITFNTLTKGGK